MNTAYADDGSFSECKEKFENAGIKFPPYVSNPFKNNNEHLCLCGKKIDELELYSGENEYYLVRRIVFSAIEYYKNKLDKDLEKALDPFNGNMQKELTDIEMRDIFENIKLNFPQRLPQNCGSVYTAALKLISGPFEADTKPHLEKKDHKALFYQKVTKTLRNWLSHNKFYSVPNQNEFLILFIVALRSYFGAGALVNDFEEKTFNLVGNSLRKVTEAEREVHNGLLNSENVSPKKYMDYIIAEGKDEHKKCYYKDLLNALWEHLYSKTYGKSIDFCDELMKAIEAEVLSEEAASANPGELVCC